MNEDQKHGPESGRKNVIVPEIRGFGGHLL